MRGAGGLTLAAALPGSLRALADPAVGDDGLFHEDWFVQSFLELPDDQAEAAAAGKHLAVLWEQRGCPYCREVHRVNFAQPAIRDYIKANFNILQLDFYGPRRVTDFDGREMSEKEIGGRWRVNFTPTINFFPLLPADAAGKSGLDAEIFRLPGYFKPFHFLTAFEYVRSADFDKMSFQRFLQAKAQKLREQGGAVEMWDDKE
jgi:thioredoxin-related protein